MTSVFCKTYKKEEEKINLSVTVVIRCMWYVFESSSLFKLKSLFNLIYTYMGAAPIGLVH